MLDEDLLNAGAASVQTASTPMSSSPLQVLSDATSLSKQLKSKRLKARVLLREVFEMSAGISDANLLHSLVQCLEPIHKQMSESLSTSSVTGEVSPAGSALEGGRYKRKLQVKKYVVPQKKLAADGTGSSQVNVIEVHIVDGSEMTDVATTSGPTFTV